MRLPKPLVPIPRLESEAVAAGSPPLRCPRAPPSLGSSRGGEALPSREVATRPLASAAPSPPLSGKQPAAYTGQHDCLGRGGSGGGAVLAPGGLLAPDQGGVRGRQPAQPAEAAEGGKEEAPPHPKQKASTERAGGARRAAVQPGSRSPSVPLSLPAGTRQVTGVSRAGDSQPGLAAAAGLLTCWGGAGGDLPGVPPLLLVWEGGAARDGAPCTPPGRGEWC